MRLELLILLVELESLLWRADWESTVGREGVDEISLEAHRVPILSGHVLLGGPGGGEMHGDISVFILVKEYGGLSMQD